MLIVKLLLVSKRSQITFVLIINLDSIHLLLKLRKNLSLFELGDEIIGLR